MEDVARVVLALEAPEVVEEVMHFLDRTGHARVVATANDDRQLTEAVRQLDPDAVVAQPSLVDPGVVRGRLMLAVDTRESVTSLRAAIGAGARGFFHWPHDRDDLAGAVIRSIAGAATPDRRATVIAVHGARGGVGTTFVATHLAAAFVRMDRSCILLDLDPLYGDVGAALGAPHEDHHTIADLLPLVDELTPEHLDNALWIHPSGVRTLLAPPPDEAARVDGIAHRSIVVTAATHCDALVLHVPRALDPSAEVLGLADRVLEILSLDVLSFRAARRALEVAEVHGVRGRPDFVVNRAGRGEITHRDVVRVFGRAPLAVIPVERGVARAQDHGRLLSPRGRVSRVFDRLASQMSETTTPHPDAAEGSPA